MPAAALRRPLRLVVADDERDTVMTLTEILWDEGHSVAVPVAPGDTTLDGRQVAAPGLSP